MPKQIELTVEIDVDRVSCPGVWLCQDGRVSLSVFTLGTSYQTCLLPPFFPLVFKDVFFFRKRYEQTCALNNICCLLKEESIYCELIQWCDNCNIDDCTILAQYVGSLNDILFPSNVCSNEGVDLLMRRNSNFPGILSPKIEIATKVRIDELINHSPSRPAKNAKKCGCKMPDPEMFRQKQVCHSPIYHRNKCNHRGHTRSSTCLKDGGITAPSVARPNSCRYAVYNVQTAPVDDAWQKVTNFYEPSNDDESLDLRTTESEKDMNPETRLNKIIVRSQLIDPEHFTTIEDKVRERRRQIANMRVRPCVCEICRRYHDLFHTKPLY